MPPAARSWCARRSSRQRDVLLRRVREGVNACGGVLSAYAAVCLRATEELQSYVVYDERHDTLARRCYSG